MSSYQYIRFWCDTCMRETTFRRYAPSDAPNAKIECVEHGPHQRDPVDWVRVAIDAGR